MNEIWNQPFYQNFNFQKEISIQILTYFTERGLEHQISELLLA